jgi:hypothetical protein
MKKVFLVLLVFIAILESSLAQGTRIDLAAGKEDLREILRWKDKGLVVLGRSKTETNFYFIDGSGMRAWEHSIPNDAFQCAWSKSTFSANAGHVYFIAWVNDGAGAHVYLYKAGEDGKFIAKEKQYDKFRILTAEVTDEGAILVMKDNAKKDADRHNRLVRFDDETGEQSISVDIELPEGTWYPQGVFNNALVLKGSGGRVDDGERRDTLCFLSPSGKLLDKICLVMKLPEGQEVAHYPRYYFNEDEKCIYSWLTIREDNKFYQSRFCIIKYDADGKILYTLNKKFSELVSFNEEMAKKEMYTESLMMYFHVNSAYGGLAFIFEPELKPKKTAIVSIGFDGEIRQVTVRDHFYINEKFFVLSGDVQVPKCRQAELDAFTTIHATTLKPAIADNPETLRKLAGIAAGAGEEAAYYTVERIGIKDLVLEYLPKEAVLKVHH